MPCDSAAAEGRAIRSEVVEVMLCGSQARTVKHDKAVRSQREAQQVE